ncbi:MAG: virulence RhuM family protein, partial [Paramuribaculum sp.]|nr:virulence RhuM family protein [Paramuribaculum sp.]
LVDIFLTSAELRVRGRQDLTLQYWRDNIEGLLNFQDKPVLKDKGAITSAQMEQKVKEIYNEFNEQRKAIEANVADQEDQMLLDDISELNTYLY